MVMGNARALWCRWAVALGTAILLLSVGSLEALCAGDWPTYLNNVERTGSTNAQLTLPLALRWQFCSSNVPQASNTEPENRIFEGHLLRHRIRFDDALPVVVSNERVYFGSSVDHQLRCLQSSSGKELWSFFTDGPIRLSPTVANGKVYCGSDDGFVYCLDAITGELIWKLRAGPNDEWLIARGEMISRWPVRTGVLVVNGVAYFGAGVFPHENVFLYAVDANTGKTIWKNDTISQQSANRDDLSPQGYLLLTEKYLMVPSGRSLPAVIDRQTGRMVRKLSASWRTSGGGVVGGSRAILADEQVYCWGAHHIVAMNPETGRAGYGYFDGHEFSFSGEFAYACNGTSLMKVARDPYAKASRTRHKLEMERLSLSQKLRGAKNADEIRRQIRELQDQIDSTSKDGVLWSVPSKADAALVVAGTAVIAGGKGEVIIYDAETGKELWKTTVAGQARELAVAADNLFVGTTTGDIYCYSHTPIPEGIAAVHLPEAPGEPSPFPADALTEMYQRAADDIIQHSKVTQGFCLVIGSETGRLAYELALRSNLKIYGVEPDLNKVIHSRHVLSQAGFYGHRVTIHHADLTPLPYSNYFANLIVSDTLLLEGRLPGNSVDAARHLKPLGGVICVGHPLNSPAPTSDMNVRKSWLNATGLLKDELSALKSIGSWTLLTRGALPGAGKWTHQYGEPGNTACSDDRRVKGGLGVLWYGDPGEGKMVNRHDGAVGPLAVNGRLIVQGQDRIMAYDAYNGLFLWERENPRSIRTGVFQNENPGNLAADDNRLFYIDKDICFELDAATGKLIREHQLPKSNDGETHQWGYVACHEGLLFGTASTRDLLKSIRRGKVTEDATDAIFAIDVATGDHLWSYQGKSISHRTIAIADNRVFFVDSSLTSKQRDALLRQDKSTLKELTGKAAEQAEKQRKTRDVRMAVALDARTGKKTWERPVDVTDCSEIGTGGGKLTLMVSNNVLVFCGANANGHFWQQFLAGEFSRRRLVALAADDGHVLWAKDANYRHRPIIVEDRIVAEPWGFDLYTGAQQMRAHPLTGKLEPWSFMRSGHHCGMIAACPNMLMFRSGFTGFYDLQEDRGTEHIAGHRTGCWINAIPANGLVMIPEASAGCVCLFSISSTVVMEPRSTNRPWAIYSSVGSSTPVKNMALNLGGPGDRRDARGTIWLAYPRPRPSRQTGLDLPLDAKQVFLGGGHFDFVNAEDHPVENTDNPWIYSSWAEGLSKLSIPLLTKEDQPSLYRVTFHWAETDPTVKAGERVFDVHLQGKRALTAVDVVSRARESRRALTLEVANVPVTERLEIELVPQTNSQSVQRGPMLHAIEITREDTKHR